MKSQYDYVLEYIAIRGEQNREAIKAHHDHQAGQRGAFGKGPDSFLHKGERSLPNRHHRIGSHRRSGSQWITATFNS